MIRARVTSAARRAAASCALVLGAVGGLASPVAASTGETAGSRSKEQAASTPAARVGAARVPDLRWRGCGGPARADGLQCATAEVPLSHRRPHGATTTLALTRLPATDPERRLGSLFVNPGGPGASGADFVRDLGELTFSERVRSRYDVIGFGPRFVGASDPATCYRTAEDEARVIGRFTAFPTTAAEVRRHVRQRTALVRACQDRAGRKMRHGSTANVARDLDLLRRAVGDRRLSFVGFSYGTFLGATYARLFPQRVGRLVADGAVDPVSYSGRDGDRRSIGARAGQAPAAVRAFDEFLRVCREVGERCALNALGDPERVVARTLDQLEDEPVVIDLGGVPTEIDHRYAIALSFDAMASPATWTPLADIFAALAAGSARSEAGRRPLPSVAWPAGRSAESDAGRAAAGGEPYPSVGGTFASACVDAPVRIEPGDFDRLAQREERRHPRFGRFRAWNGVECAGADLADPDAYRGGWRQETRREVLVIGTRFDASTPYVNTAAYARLFPRASVLTVEGYGHTTIGLSSCAQRAMTRYLVGGKVPAAGATCGQDVRPFATGPAAGPAVVS